MKNRRIPLIRQLVKEHAISTQSQLKALLEERGERVTQATLSRDIKTMGVQKRFDDLGEQRYYLPEDPIGSSQSYGKLGRLLRDSMISLRWAQNMVVLKTIPGHAHAVASQFDSLDWGDLVGTLAGDDTLLLIVKDKETALDVLKRVETIME